MTLNRALCAAALIVPLVIAGTHSSRADVFDFGPVGPCYDYDPHDWYHLFGKYYPYSCRHRELDRNYIVEATSAPSGTIGCVKTNIKNFKNAC